MRRIAVVTTSRADYGIYKPILRAIEAAADLDLFIIVSGAHLSPDHGMTVRDILSDGFHVAERVEALMASDSSSGTAISMGLALIGYSQALTRLNPDILLVLGDRFEMHAAALAALPFKIPVAHIHGGELTEGAFDDALRHSTTKLSHLHFVATESYGRRVVQLGEEPWRVTVCGAPSLDNLRTMSLKSHKDMEKELDLTLGEHFLLATFHPATLEKADPGDQAQTVLNAVLGSGLPAVVTMPNADPGGKRVREVILRMAAQHSTIHVVENLGTESYFSLMALAAAMVGNSSSGIIEAACFGLPVVNVGDRQRGRVRGPNVVDSPCEASALASALRQALSPDFKLSFKGLANPYGDGRAAERIVTRLQDVKLGVGLIKKRFIDAQQERTP